MALVSGRKEVLAVVPHPSQCLERFHMTAAVQCQAVSDAAPRATVVITTKNRCEDAARAVESALAQTVPVEILVIDDGSTDSTAEKLRSQFPSVRIEHRTSSAGYIARRNEAARIAASGYLFSLDDDALFSTPHVVARTLEDFRADDRIAAVAIPCIDVLKSDQRRQPLPDLDDVYVTSEYIGTAHAIRKDVFLKLGGYREVLVHQGEERDFCIRLLDAGYFVRLGTADPIHHFESPKRDRRRQDRYGQRNNLLYAWQNAPGVFLPIHWAGTTIKTLRFGLRHGTPLGTAHHVLIGFIDSLRLAGSRRPVSHRTWRLSRKLRRAGAMPLGSAESLLTPEHLTAPTAPVLNAPLNPR